MARVGPESVMTVNMKRIESVVVTVARSGHQIKRGEKQKVETPKALNKTFQQGFMALP